MPKNKGKGGKKFKKYKKGETQARSMSYKNEKQGQCYAVVRKMLGNGRLRAICEDGKERLCSIRGILRKRKGVHLISKEDMILISKRPFNDKLGDVLHKYNDDEKRHFIQGRNYLTEESRRVLFYLKEREWDVEFNENAPHVEESDDDDDDFKIEANPNRHVVGIEEDNIPKVSVRVDKRKKTREKRQRRNDWRSDYKVKDVGNVDMDIEKI